MLKAIFKRPSKKQLIFDIIMIILMAGSGYFFIETELGVSVVNKLKNKTTILIPLLVVYVLGQKIRKDLWRQQKRISILSTHKFYIFT